MKTDHWEAVSARFLEAAELPVAALPAFLANLAAQDPELAREVESLLAAHAGAGDFLEAPLALAATLGTKARGGSDRPVEDLPCGATVDGFEILRELGRGAFATVYLARDVALDRLIALKVSRIRGHEARTMASLEHDHIVRVFSERIDAERRARLICMQYIPGASLRRVVEALGRGNRAADAAPLTAADLTRAVDSLCREPPVYDPALARERHCFEQWSFAEATAWLGGRMARALEHAHQVGVLHLDVKPDNILITQYARPFLADFNVSLAREPTKNANGEGDAGDGDDMLGGTFSYMAPEHRRAYKIGTPEAFRAMTPATDVYALGVVLHECLTGKHPKARDAQRLDATALLADARDLCRIIAPSLAEDPDDRYPTALSFGARLDGFLTLMKLRRSLPPAGFIARVSLAHVILGLVLFVTLPQTVGSLVNISYNASRIVAGLDMDQRLVFQVLLWIMNPVLYGAGIGAMVFRALPLHRVVKEHERAKGPARPLTDAERLTLRRRALGLPGFVAAVLTIGWGVGLVAFPVGIHVFGGPLRGIDFLHFGVSFFLSWIVALTYSFLYVQYLVVRVLYPRLLLGDDDLGATATRELRGIGSRLQLYQAMAGLIPSLAATLLLGSESLVAGGAQFDAYRWLLVGLIAAGIVGFLVALRTSNVLGRTIFALTSTGQERA